MSVTAVRGFLAAVSVGLDLPEALAVGDAARGRTKARFAAARQALLRGEAVEDSLRPITDAINPHIAWLLGTANAEQRPRVAERLLEMLSTDPHSAADVRRAVNLLNGLYGALVAAILGLLVIGMFRSLGALSEIFFAPDGGRLFAVAILLLLAAVVTSIHGLSRASQASLRISWTGRMASDHPGALLLVAAGAEAGVSHREVIAQLGLSNGGQLPGLRVDIEHIAHHRWPTDPAGQPWVRAAHLARRTMQHPIARLTWSTYLSMMLSSVGIGTAIIAAWQAILQFGDPLL